MCSPMASPGEVTPPFLALSLLRSVFFGKPSWMLPTLATVLGVEGAEMLKTQTLFLGAL